MIVDNTLPLTNEETDSIPVPANLPLKDLEVKGKFYPSDPVDPTTFNMVDPPSGWRFGFPMRYEPDKDGDLEQFLIKKGYPAKDVEFATQHSRFWHEPDNEDKK